MIRAVIAFALLLLVAVPARAEGDAARVEARKLLDDGVRLYKGGQLEAALDWFLRAYDKLPTAGLLLNIGTTQRKLGRNAEAANTYQRYLDDPAADAGKLGEVEATLAGFHHGLGLLLLAATAPGAEIQVGEGSWRPAGEVRMVRVGPGAQVVRARKGELVVEVTVVVGAGERKEVQVPPPRTEPTAAPESDERARPRAAKRARRARHDPGKTRRLIGLGVGAAGVIAAGVGVGFAARASGRFGDARAICGDGCPPGEDYDHARALSDGGLADRRLSMILIGAGAAAIAGGTVLWLTAPRAERRVDVAFAPGEVGVTLAGRF